MTADNGFLTRDELRQHLLEMYDFARELLDCAKDGKYQEGDVRNSFHTTAGQTFGNYSIQLAMFYAINPAGIEDREVENVLSNMLKNPVQDDHWNRQRRHLYLDIWCGFEDPVRHLYNTVVPEKLREEDRQKRGFVSMPTIWQRVADVAAESGKAVNEPRYKALVEFLGPTRNTIHANSFYHGKYRSLKLETELLELRDGEPTDFLSMRKLPRLTRELVAAASFLREGLQALPFIESPIWLHLKRQREKS